VTPYAGSTDGSTDPSASSPSDQPYPATSRLERPTWPCGFRPVWWNVLSYRVDGGGVCDTPGPVGTFAHDVGQADLPVRAQAVAWVSRGDRREAAKGVGRVCGREP